MNLPDFLTERPFGSIVLTGHRIGLYHLIDSYKQGMDLERLHEWYPSLEPELIQKVLDFYHANQSEVDAYVAEVQARIEQQVAAASPIDWEGRRRRAEERKRVGGN